MWQKKKLQKQYAAAYRAAHSAGDAAAAAQTAAKGAKKSADAAKKAGEFVSKHKKAFLIVGGIGLLLVMLLGLLQSCSSIFGGGVFFGKGKPRCMGGGSCFLNIPTPSPIANPNIV